MLFCHAFVNLSIAFFIFCYPILSDEGRHLNYFIMQIWDRAHILTGRVHCHRRISSASASDDPKSRTGDGRIWGWRDPGCLLPARTVLPWRGIWFLLRRRGPDAGLSSGHGRSRPQLAAGRVALPGEVPKPGAVWRRDRMWRPQEALTFPSTAPWHRRPDPHSWPSQTTRSRSVIQPRPRWWVRTCLGCSRWSFWFSGRILTLLRKQEVPENPLT
jgi:hypothetical protein